MRLPSKVFTYKESILSKLAPVLQMLIDHPQSVLSLYIDTKHHFEDITEFIECLDCLYALGKIQYDDENEVVHYVG